MSRYVDPLDIDHEATKWGRRTVLGLVLTAVTLLAVTGHETTDNGRNATPVAHTTEDDPAWNCATMGNHICGRCP